jgi:pyrimidine deaminase RibD-like protein
MRATEFITESQEIHNRPKLDSVLGRCIELLHDKRQANPGKYGRVAACIIDHKNRKVFGINSPGANGTRRHAERVAIDTYHKRYGKILPGAIIVTTLSPCNRDMAERDGPSCQDLLLQVGIEKVYSGYMDPSQHSDHPFTEEVTKNDDLWRRCKELSDSFVHDDLSEDLEQGVAEALEHISVNETINPDILNRRFRHTQTIGDYTYKASVEIFLDEPLLNIKAYDGAKEIGHVMFEIFHWDDAPAKSHIESGGTEVEPAYRNKGVASTMYAYAKMLGNDVRSSNMQSAQGHTMWAAWKHSGGAKHLTGQVAENFADGKNPQDKGDSKRHGVPTKASVSTLRKVAKQGGRKGQLAHWMANMKAGRAKAKKK